MSPEIIAARWRRASGRPVARHSCRIWRWTFLAASCAFCALLAARGQDINTPSLQSSNTPPFQYSTAPVFAAADTNLPPLVVPAYAPVAPPGPPLAGTSQLYAPAAAPLPALPPMFRWGPLMVDPHLYYGLSYGNGIQASPGNLNSSFVNAVDPGVLLRWGSHWSLDYTALLNFYSSSAFQNTFNNAVTLNGGTSYEDWTFGLSQSYASSSDPIIETGVQTEQETLSTLLSADYQMSSKTSLQLGASQAFRLGAQTTAGQQLNNYNSWSTLDWLNYQFWARFGAAIGAGFTYYNVQTGSDMTSEQIQARITWVVVEKLSLTLSGGGQDTQFLGSGAPNLISPVYSLSLQYSPFGVTNGTTLSLSGYSGVTPSFYQDQVTESTSIGAGLHQRLLGRLFLDLNGGYSTSTYHSTVSASTASSLANYETTFFGARLATTFLKRGTAGVFYTANFNSSGATVYNYNTTMVGLDLTYRY